jgi:hypothetical protein
MTTIFMVYPPLSATETLCSTLQPDDEIQNALRSAGGGHKPEEVIKPPLTTLSTSNAIETRMSRICSGRHSDEVRVVVDCRCRKAHQPANLPI